MTKWTVCVLICALAVGCQSEQAPAVAEVPKADIQTKPPTQDKKFAPTKDLRNSTRRRSRRSYWRE